jgi:hypothetical protein
VIAGVEGAPARPARLTFAMARHAVVDLAPVLGQPPIHAGPERLPRAELTRLHAELAAGGVVVDAAVGAVDKPGELRAMYEPAWRAARSARENWRTPPWGQAHGPSSEGGYAGH